MRAKLLYDRASTIWGLIQTPTNFSIKIVTMTMITPNAILENPCSTFSLMDVFLLPPQTCLKLTGVLPLITRTTLENIHLKKAPIASKIIDPKNAPPIVLVVK